MRKLIAIIIITSVFLVCQGAISSEKEGFNLPIKELYSEPSEDSLLVYDIPIEVQLLDISEDYNWYKVKIGFNIGPFAYSYTGWTPIPVQEFLEEKAFLEEEN